MTKKPKPFKPYKRFRIALADTDSVRPEEFEARIQFPCYASFKKDGVRASVSPVHPDKIETSLVHTEAGWITLEADEIGHGITRSLKYIPNHHVRRLLSTLPHGLDGEIGILTDGKLNFRGSTSAVMTQEGEPDIRYYVFEHFLAPGGKTERLDALKALELSLPSWVVILEQRLLKNAQEAVAMFYEALENDDEGLIFCSLDAPYKPGRSTVLEGFNVKAKDKADLEGVCIGRYEEKANTNEATLDERGYTKRSTHKAGKVAKGIAGGLLVLFPEWPGKVARVASGLNAKQKAEFYDNPPLGKFIKMSYALAGDYDLPRHGVFEGIRDPSDMDPARVKVLEDLYAAWIEDGPETEAA
ncbi:putative DNA ligase [Caulobacter virus Karma]|uniref:Putative DNA ligase n=1 Tax=Caulobacter phage CcrSwift TaxID=2927984 RepID=K4JTM8_9CAUD|nr:putative DNA ligase [Caulobacter virus Magneto]YP_006989533.1 putative DNA ligase [Caulobacter virus Karma]YP_006989881.1 putative DNA ligase [Caulobacter phage CcrSwift]AFU87319.1 putative DNA ligase [Caulobacter virus Magneto]AFU87670.1 putative DNA ligase [Caulobacter virus Karma]AFU88466.1 putative DNA ligase [Caulobacter phage CcrSwift]